MTITLSQQDYWDLVQSNASSYQSPDQVNWGADITWKYPKQLGQGFIRDIQLRDGIDLAIEEACLKDDVVVKQCDRSHPLEYTFELINSAGKSQQHYNLYGSGLAPGESWRIPGKRHTTSINVHIEPERFQQWIGGDSEFPQAVQPLLRSQDEEYYQSSGTPTAAMQMTVQQLLSCPFQGLTQQLYLESKVWELMALLINELHTSASAASAAKVLRSDDVERIHYASQILRQRLLNPPSLIELARATGINDHKLKIGFRQVFGTTVFGYLHERRMERSRQLLESGDVNVTQAAHAVGFANRGHFAAAFRRKYGVNPGIYLRQKRA